MPSSFLNEALRYASMGYRVFPLAPGSKDQPYTEHGHLDASDDPDVIAAWWQRTPTANIGIAAAGLVVVDFDPGCGDWPGPERARDFAGCPIQRTPRGGKHVVFSAGSEEYKKSESALASKVDIRAGSSYFVASPSVRSEGAYSWATPLEPVEELPVVPAWLHEALRAAEKPKTKQEASSNGDGDGWATGKRNGNLTSMGGRLRRAGLGSEAIDAALQQVNLERCKPPLSASDVSKIAASVGRYERGADPDGDSGEEIEFTGVSCAELAKGDYSVRFLIENTLCEGQPCLVGAAAKSLKTILCIDAAVSLATATPFLGHEWCGVPEAQRVVYMSGEGGLTVIQDYARRVAASKGFDLGAVSGLTFCNRLPQLADIRHLDALRRFLTDHEATVAFLDPAYLCMPSDNSGNVMAQGSILRHVNNMCQDIGVTPVLIHHTKRNTGRDPYGPPELADLSWAGFAEFAGQWWAVGRREAYDGDNPGEHALWLHVGGRAGHSALHALDVREGSLADVGGRYWSVEVQRAGEVRKRAKTTAAERKAQEREEQRKASQDRDLRELCNLLAEYPAGQTKNLLKEELGFNTTRMDMAVAAALRGGHITHCEITRGNRTTPYAGYKLATNE